MVEMITKREISGVAERAMKRWKAGQPVFREMTQIRTWTTLHAFEGIVPETDWFTDLLYRECSAARQFGRYVRGLQTGTSVYTALHGDMDVDMMAAISWTVLRTLSHSDTPNWFRLSEGLAHQFLVTELRDVQACDVQMPYPGFYLELPPGLLWWRHQATGRHEVRMVAVAEGNPSRVSVPKSAIDGDDAFGRRLLTMVCCEPNENSKDPSDDNVAYFSLPLMADHATVEELLQLERSRQTHNLDWKRNQDRPFVYFGGRELSLRDGCDLVASLIVNVLLYLSSEGADVQHAHKTKIAKLQKGPHAKRKKTKNRIQELKNDRVFDVGTTVRVCPDIKKYIESGRRGPKFELKHRVLVRGHWRNQAHGPKRMLRKRIFIKPFVKKKDLPERVSGHNYEVG